MGNFLSKCCRKGCDERHGYVHIDGNNQNVTYSERNPKTRMGVKPLNQAEKKKLESFFQHIISKAPVDFTSPEIQDIQEAVQTMLERIRERVNNRGVFNISHIVPTGSMAEKTAIWKYNYYQRKPSLEFDNLAVLKESVRQCEYYRDHQRCLGCISISNPPVELTLLPQSQLDLIRKRCIVIKPTKDQISKHTINEIFLYEINNCLASSCACLTLHCERNKYSFKPSSVDNNDGCDMCTVDTPTGTLSVNTNKHIDLNSVGPNRCSLILLWTSKTNSLLAPDMLLQQKQLITSMPIYIDFLPAMEYLKPTSPGAGYTHDYFVVPKNCNVCDNPFARGNAWRKSWCIAEIQALQTEMSVKHRRCYQITKYLTKDSFGLYVNKYLLKNVVLQHSTTCSDTSDNYVDCVIEVHQDILNAYTRKEFLSYHSNINILSGADHLVFEICEAYYREFLTQLYSVSETDEFDRFVTRLRSSSKSAANTAYYNN